MKKLSLLAFMPILFFGCKTVFSTAMQWKTAYLHKELQTERPLLDISKEDIYQVSAIMECPKEQKVDYKIQHVLIYPDKDGERIVEGTRSNHHVTDFNSIREVKSGTIWSYKATFNTPVKQAKFMVKVGDSVVLSKILSGKDVKVDYGFRLP